MTNTQSHITFKWHATALVLSLFCTQFLPAQQSTTEDIKNLRKEVESLKEGQKGIQNDLQEIKKLLLAKPGTGQHQAIGAVLNVDGKPFKGDKNARVTLIEFSDYQCPFCARHVRETMAQIEKDYVGTGKLKYVFQDLALKFHAHAQKAGEAALCAGDQGKYWEMHAQLFTHQQQLAPTNLPTHATAIGLDMTKFQQCLDSGKYATQVTESGAGANKIGFSGTPSFVLGLTQPNDSNVKVVKVIVGAKKYDEFQAAIDSLLSAPPAGEPAAKPK